jgi:hypothetical protein
VTVPSATYKVPPSGVIARSNEVAREKKPAVRISAPIRPLAVLIGVIVLLSFRMYKVRPSGATVRLIGPGPNAMGLPAAFVAVFIFTRLLGPSPAS